MWRLASAALLLACVLVCVNAQYILAPSYISPYDDGWNKIIAAGPRKVPIALVNPNNGPGPSGTDSYVLAYKALTQRLQAAGIKVFGYVDSNYGTVPINTVLTQSTNFYSWMGVNGIFIDQASTNCGLTSYYNQVYTLVKNRGGEVILNPGTPTNECYMAVGDIMLSAETSWAAYSASSYPSPSWVTKYPRTRFWHVAYNVPAGSMQAAVQLAYNRHAAYVYFTELGLPNPYAPLTSNWNALVSAIATVPGGGAAPATPKPATAAPAPAPVTSAPSASNLGGNVVALVAPNPMPVTAGPVWRMMQAAFSADGQFLRINFTSYAAFNLNGAPSSTWSRVNFYLDLDNNPATGWSVNGGAVGSEMLVQGERSYRQSATAFNSGNVGSVTASATQNVISCTLSIPVADIRAVNPSFSTIRIVGGNDQTNQFIPPTGSYVATSR
jgi:hypothetical protein